MRGGERSMYLLATTYGAPTVRKPISSWAPSGAASAIVPARL
jgi:hypothetical protein